MSEACQQGGIVGVVHAQTESRQQQALLRLQLCQAGLCGLKCLQLPSFAGGQSRALCTGLQAAAALHVARFLDSL